MPARREIQYPQLAKAFADYMTKNDVSMPDLSEMLGLPRTSTVAYPWVRGHGRPSKMYYDRIVEKTGIPLPELIGEPVNTRGQWSTKPKSNRDSNHARAERRRLARMPTEAIAATVATPVVVERTGRPASADRPLSFDVIGETGTARVRLDVVLPLDQAFPLFRMLMDAGYLYGSKENGNER